MLQILSFVQQLGLKPNQIGTLYGLYETLKHKKMKDMSLDDISQVSEALFGKKITGPKAQQIFEAFRGGDELTLGEFLAQPEYTAPLAQILMKRPGDDRRSIICPHCQAVQEVPVSAEVVQCIDCEGVLDMRPAEEEAA